VKHRAVVASGLILGSVAAVITLLARYGIGPVLAWIAAARGMSGTVFVIVYVLAAIVLVPDSLLTIAAGVIFGLVRGVILVSVGSMLGAAAAFFLGRTFAREWVHRRAERWLKFHAMNRAISRHGFWLVFLTRLSPIIPYGPLNYAYSITTVRVRDYLIASWIGMLPATVLYVYAGTVAATLTAVIAGRTSLGQKGNILLFAGLLATIVMIVLLTYFTKRELARELES
jgi:uncharacterized membrane protein YdjX (TVP38/TMEM64 family)